MGSKRAHHVLHHTSVCCLEALADGCRDWRIGVAIWALIAVVEFYIYYLYFYHICMFLISVSVINISVLVPASCLLVTGIHESYIQAVQTATVSSAWDLTAIVFYCWHLYVIKNDDSFHGNVGKSHDQIYLKFLCPNLTLLPCLL